MNGSGVRAQYQPFPNLDAPVVNEDRIISIPWYQFFVTLWNREGLGRGVPANAVNLTNLTSGGSQSAAATTISPLLFAALEVGMLLVNRKYNVVPATGVRTMEAGGETVEFSRDSGLSWWLAGHAPMVIPLALGDQVRVSWFTAKPPQVVFFPASR